MRWGGRCAVAALGGAVGVVVAAAPAGAHVKWFVDPDDPSRPRVDWSLVFSGRTLAVIAVAGTAVAAMWIAQRVVGSRRWPHLRLFEPLAVGAPTLLAVQAGIAVVFAAAQPAIFVPNIPLPHNAVGFAIAAIAMLAGFSLITGIGDWVGGVVLMLLVPLSLFRGRYFDTFDMLFWIGIGITIVAIGRAARSPGDVRAWLRRRNPSAREFAVAALRVLTGFAIVAAALSEKIWNPRLGEAFLADHTAFNILGQGLGLDWFTGDRFVLLAGVVEATVGVLLVAGFLPRVVILAMWVPFNLGIPFLPPQELIGHLPILGIMYFLLVEASPTGADGRGVVASPRPTSDDTTTGDRTQRVSSSRHGRRAWT